MITIFCNSFTYSNLANSQRNHYVCGSFSNCVFGGNRRVHILAGSIQPLSDTTMLLTYSNKDISNPHNGGYYRVHKKMIMDCKNKRYQVLDKSGKVRNDKWKCYDEFSNRILDIVIKPEARYLYK
jgi:hypothetical protein